MSDLVRVTDVIAASGLQPPYPTNGNYLELGHAVDAGSRLLFAGYRVDDLEPLDPLVKPCLISLELWLEHSDFRVTHIQREVVDSLLGLKGHPDVEGYIANDDWTIDTKTGGKSKAYRLQTAAYQYLTKTKRRGCLYLSEKGIIAKLDPHEDSSDWNCFLSILRWMQGEKALQVYKDNVARWKEAT